MSGKGLTITYEPSQDGYTFCHITSTTGVLGHAAEIKNAIPRGTLLTLGPKYYRLTPWMIKKMNFRYVIRVPNDEGEVVDLLIKE